MKISRYCRRWLTKILGIFTPLLLIGVMVNGQTTSEQSAKSSMHQHYDAAYRLQSLGKTAQADVEHRRFLVAALNHLANAYANTGDYAHAAPAYDEALILSPQDFGLLMDYAGASLDAHDAGKAKSLLQGAIGLDERSLTDKQNAQVRRMLGSTLQAMGDTKGAIVQFQAAIALDSTLDNLCALGDAVLELDGYKPAAAIFVRVLAKFGDTAAVRMRIGRIYAVGGVPDRAVEEFRKAVADDYKMPGVHYSLGAALMSNAAGDLPKAEVEFHKELELHPNDTFSYPQLAAIAVRRHDYREAEIDFKHAVVLNPLNPDIFMDLGKLYVDTERPQDAEEAFRKAIELTVDPSRNYYAIERAHYRLGRLLLAEGNKSEGARELQISQELLAKRALPTESKLNGKTIERSPLERTKVATPKEAYELKAFAKQVGSLIAGSYNNLGVHSAMVGEPAKAAGYFQLAAKWDPTLSGVDSNWGRAAFAAHDCAQAVGPLQRSLDTHASDPELRAMLNQCHDMTPIMSNP